MSSTRSYARAARLSELPPWREPACRQPGVDAELFFAPDYESSKARLKREKSAKAVCGRCPIVDACREHALSAPEPHGVWGGLDEEERRAARGEAHNRRRREKRAMAKALPDAA